MASKKKSDEPTYRWDGPETWVPGWGELKPGQTLKESELPPGTHPLMALVKEDDHE